MIHLQILALTILLALPTLFAFVVAQRFTHPPWYYQTARTPTQGLNYGYGSVNWMKYRNNPLIDFNITFQDVEFEGPHGSTLRGWYIPAENSTKGVVGVHGAGLDRREFLKMSPILHKAGYHVLLFDCREHGISTGSLRGFTYGIREHNDVISAVKYLKTEYALSKVAVLGTSQGGTSTILAASKDENIDAIIVENPFASLDELLTDVINGLLTSQPDWTEDTGIAGYLVNIGNYVPHWYRNFLKYVTVTKIVMLAGEGNPINAGDVISSLHQPLFLIHGTADSLIPIHHTHRLFAKAHEPKQLWVAEGCEHAGIWYKYRTEYEEKVVSFLNQYL